MADALRHRGPDDEGFWTGAGGELGLAHRRLSIIDLAGGHQPLANEDGRVVVVLNGEIYNYRELRTQLLAQGHRFATQTDTEVVVHLYEECGTELVHRLRGMFAFALWDERERCLVLMRDRVGKKPLYYQEAAGEFLFASELKALAAAPSTALDVDEQALADYLAWGHVHPPATIYRQVRAVSPGELLVVRDRRLHSRQKYWQLRLSPKTPIRPAEAVEEVDQLLREAVRLRLRADVPVGVFLSGGIDSGVITALAAREQGSRLLTVTIGFSEEAFDERPLARLVAERYETEHHEVVIRPDATVDLPKIARAYDQPFADSSALPSYYVAQAARQFVKVVLNGDGGDELFAGYRRYVAGRISRWVGWADHAFGRAGWRLLGRCLPTPRSHRSGYAFAHRLVRGLGADPVERYLAWSVDMLSEEDKLRLSGLEGQTAAAPEPAANRWLLHTEPSGRLVRPYLESLRGCGPVDRMLGTDYQTILPHALLVKMDIACMAHGLEGRSPLLDQVLTERVARFPEAVKLPGLRTKPILRDLSRRYLPESVQVAQKRGFELPVVRWLRGELRSFTADVVLARQGLLAERFARRELERLLRNEEGLDISRWARRTWTLMMLGLWDACVHRERVPAMPA